MSNPERLTTTSNKLIYRIDRWLSEPDKIFNDVIERVQPRITPDLLEWEKGSRAVDENGGPLLFHLTRNVDFEEFDPNRMDFGIHAGTWDQVVDYAHTMQIFHREIEQVRVIPLLMKIAIPLLCNDVGTWKYPSLIYAELSRLKIIDKQNIPDPNFQPATQSCRRYLEKLGFDGVGYWNCCEGSSKQRSWLVWREEQVRVLG